MEKYICRSDECNKDFVNASNRLKHEKKTGHYIPVRRRSSLEPLWDEERRLFKCPRKYCSTSLTKKGNMVRHIATCNIIAARKQQRQNDKECPYCDKVFVKKFNRDRHVTVIHHANGTSEPVPLSFTANDTDSPSTSDANFLNSDVYQDLVDTPDDDVDTPDLENSHDYQDLVDTPDLVSSDHYQDLVDTPDIDVDTTIFVNSDDYQDLVDTPDDEVDTPDLENSHDYQDLVDTPDLVSSDHYQDLVDTPDIDVDTTIFVNSDDYQDLVDTPDDEVDTTDFVIHSNSDDYPTESNAGQSQTQNDNANIGLPDDIIEELLQLNESRENEYEEHFRKCTIDKIERDFKSKFHKNSAVTYLLEIFGDVLYDMKFVSWLCQKISYRPYKLRSLINKYQKDKQFEPRNSLDPSVSQIIYDYWNKSQNCITTTDCRNDRNEVRKSKFMYQVKYKHFKGIIDSNIQEKEVIHKKSGKKKVYMVAHRKVYTKPIRKMYDDFIKEVNMKCSFTIFFKYRPFYIVPPSEREKESCLCIRCSNAHYLLQGINNYRKSEKLSQHSSVTEFLKLNFLNPSFVTNDMLQEAIKEHPEFTDLKKVSYYVFESKEEKYYKNGQERMYSRTARVDKYLSVSHVVHDLLTVGEKYLRHRSHVNNVAKVFPVMRETFKGKFIELDFSENISLKPKFEVQEAHFSGKQYALHCSIVEPGDKKYVYHLSDDTTHDASFVHEVLEDIFQTWKIKDENVMIKSDNAPSQYKDRYAFWSLQRLADNYNVTVIRVYGAAGHGKGLIDAMSSFGVKSILRRDIVTFDQWFQNSKEMRDYLAFRGEPSKMYVHLDAKLTDKTRCGREVKVIKPCMVGHLFVYKPNVEKVLVREYLCDCENCLELNFEKCNNVKGYSSGNVIEKIPKNAPIIHPINEEVAECAIENVESTRDEVDEDCAMDEDSDDIDKISQYYAFIEVPGFIAVASFDHSEPLYFIKILSKGRADKKLEDKFGHVIFPGEFYLKGTYLQKSRSKFPSKKQFTILDFDVYVSPDEVFEPFVGIDTDLRMDINEYIELSQRLNI